MVGEERALVDHADLVELLVTVGQDPLATATDRNELFAILAPCVLLSPSRFRRPSRVAPDELERLGMPVLLIWGEREPVGGAPVTVRGSAILKASRR